VSVLRSPDPSEGLARTGFARMSVRRKTPGGCRGVTGVWGVDLCDPVLSRFKPATDASHLLSGCAPRLQKQTPLPLIAQRVGLSGGGSPAVVSPRFLAVWDGPGILGLAHFVSLSGLFFFCSVLLVCVSRGSCTGCIIGW
jgi:hypothetical protein